MRLSVLLFGFLLFRGTGTQWQETGWETQMLSSWGCRDFLSSSGNQKLTLSNVRFIPRLLHVTRDYAHPHLHCVQSMNVYSLFQLQGKVLCIKINKSKVWENTAHLSLSRHLISLSLFCEVTQSRQSQQSTAPAQRCCKTGKGGLYQPSQRQRKTCFS